MEVARRVLYVGAEEPRSMSRFATFACLATLFISTGNAFADEEEDNDFTDRLKSTSEECSKVTGATYAFAGKINLATDKIPACGNISDGLRYVCQDNSKVDSTKANLRASISK